MELFGKSIEIKKQLCSKNGIAPESIADPYVNVYVRIRNRCPAKCKFCEFTCDEEFFNVDKFVASLKELASKVRVNKISFTGGEPTGDLDLLEYCLKKVKAILPNTFVVINTNGAGTLMELLKYEDYLNSIALSRHHYDDNRNKQIFGCNVPTADTIRNFQESVKNKELLHLSCNLVKGEIETHSDIKHYLNHCANINALDVGFVTLMPVNDFCKNNQVIFDTAIKQDSQILRNKVWNNGEDCRCANFLYIDYNTAKIVKFYARYYCNASSNSGQLVFDGKNLKQGFTGPIIY
jgi:molybdenum cofactor biosynthesis enzyme MoaA